MEKNKTQYLQFCTGRTDIPLFFQAWWLDQVCSGDSWEVALSFDQGGNIVGVLPYYLRSTFGLQMIRMPLLTPYLGVWLNYPDNPQKRTSQYGFEKKVITDLLRQLPKTLFASHHHPPALSNGLPFLWKDYQVENYYTYHIAADTSLEDIRSAMKASVRNKIDKAEQNLLMTESFSPEEFYEVNQWSFDRQRVKIPYDLNFFTQLDRVLSEKNQRKILVVRDKAGKTHAAIYLVWDQQTMYNLALGGDTQLRKSGAIQLLLWKGITLAMKKGLHFDFEGSVIENIESVFRDFGGERKAYLRTVKYRNRWWKALRILLKGD